MSTRKDASGRKSTSTKAPRGRRPQSQDLRAAKDAIYRKHIMEAAERVFAEQGYANTKMQSVASAVGISLATLYQAFPGKEQLHRAIRIARDTEMLAAVLQRAQQPPPPSKMIEWLLWLMETHMKYFLEHPDYLRMQLQLGHVWYHSTAWPTNDERELWERGMDFMTQIFSLGQSQELLVSGDPGDQGRMMMALQQTRLANWIGGGMKESQQSVTARVQADFVRSFCRPAKAAALLTPDGSNLNAQTIEVIRTIESTARPFKAPA